MKYKTSTVSLEHKNVRFVEFGTIWNIHMSTASQHSEIYVTFRALPTWENNVELGSLARTIDSLDGDE